MKDFLLTQVCAASLKRVLHLVLKKKKKEDAADAPADAKCVDQKEERERHKISIKREK